MQKRSHMFAVVRTGGKQYRVALGDKIVVEKLGGDAGDTITLGDVLLAGEGSDFKKTDGLKVSAEIIAQAKGEKVTVFKKKRRQNYRRKKGHRQQHTILRIVAIGDKKYVPSKADGAGKSAKPKSQATEAKSDKDDSSKKAQEPAGEKKKAEKADGAKPKAEKQAAPAKAKPAPADAKSESTKKAAPAKGAAKKDTKSKK
jgi:large subunit ribosomal protein L21